MRGARVACILGGIVVALAMLVLLAKLSGTSVARVAPASDEPPRSNGLNGRPGSSCLPCDQVLGPALVDSLVARRTLVVQRPGDTLSLSMAGFAASSLCLEGTGGFTTSAGSEISGRWAGVSLPDLLTEWAGLQDEGSVTFVADDGYRMTFEGKEILDRRQGTWILAVMRDGAPIPAAMGLIRAIKVGPSTPMITGHLSVQRINRIVITGMPPPTSSLSVRGRMDVTVDHQTLQSCVSCHGVTVRIGSGKSVSTYHGVPLFLLLAFSDDSLYAPHHHDSAMLSYRGDLARAGYAVELGNADGKVMTLDSGTIDQNEGISLALYRGGEGLPRGEAPMLVVGADTAASAPTSDLSVLHGVTSITLHLP